MKKINDWKHYSLFNEIEDSRLRVWNRCAAIFNLAKDRGPQEATLYAQQFDEIEKKQIQAMFNLISVQGYEATRRTVATDKVA